MANEGQFPKINGDILYASEVNSFYSLNFAGSNNMFSAVGSKDSTPGNLSGSIVIPAGSLTPYTKMSLAFVPQNWGGLDGTCTVQFSGTAFGEDESLTAGVGVTGSWRGGPQIYVVDGMLGNDGFITMSRTNTTNTEAATAILDSANYPNSGLVILFHIAFVGGGTYRIQQATADFRNIY